MPYYRVFLEGGNFWLQMDDAPQRMGFYTTRFVQAASVDESGKAAVGLVRSTERLKPLNHPDDPPQILVREIEEVDEADVPGVVSGFAFFPDEGEAN
jgi:hypothetical protein